MKLFLKGVVVGFGGIAPGLSGSILLIIFGLYRKVLDALGSLLTNFRQNIRLLLPLLAGMGTGVLLFSRAVNFLLSCYEMPTRFCFLGLILGTLPMVWREVRKQGFRRRYYGLILLSAGAGIWFFSSGAGSFPQVTDPTLLQCMLLGVAVAATAIIPGVDPAALLSSLGLYEIYIRALAELSLPILLPMAVGLAVGAVCISFAMSTLFRLWYTGVYSLIIGVFLTMIPQILSDNCVLGLNGMSVLSLGLMVLGFVISLWLGDISAFNEKFRKVFRKKGQ